MLGALKTADDVSISRVSYDNLFQESSFIHTTIGGMSQAPRVTTFYIFIGVNLFKTDFQNSWIKLCLYDST